MKTIKRIEGKFLMLRTIYFYIFLWVGLLLTLPAILAVEIVNIFSKAGSEALSQKTARIWGRSVVALSGSSVQVKGLENIPETGPVLFISNHQSNFDIPLLLGYLNRPVGFLSKEEMRKVPIVGRWMRHLNCVFMDRSNPRAALKSIGKAAETVKSGNAMCVFPEGTRSGAGLIGEFKPGAFKIYTKTKAALLPVAIEGTWRIQGRDTLRVKSAKVKVSVLKPADLEGIPPRDTMKIAEKVKSEIQNELQSLRGD